MIARIAAEAGGRAKAKDTDRARAWSEAEAKEMRILPGSMLRIARRPSLRPKRGQGKR